jgi:hypothetical protein
LGVQVFHGVVHEGALLPTLLCTGAPEAIEAAGAAISKGHLLLSHHFSGRQYLLKLYCMDTRLLVAIVGRQTPTLILNNFICCTMLRAQKKSENGRILPDVKAISDVIGIPYFQKCFVLLVNDIKSFDFDHNCTKVIPRPLALFYYNWLKLSKDCLNIA